eukprot:3932318-Rhodomonas_salina.1
MAIRSEYRRTTTRLQQLTISHRGTDANAHIPGYPGTPPGYPGGTGTSSSWPRAGHFWVQLLVQNLKDFKERFETTGVGC